MKFAELAQRGVKGDQRLEISISNTGERTIATANSRDESPMRLSDGPEIAHYQVGEKVFNVSQKSFWQSHKDAPVYSVMWLLNSENSKPAITC